MLGTIQASMISSLSKFIGGKGPENEEPHGQASLPASWYTSESFFEMERRAVYAKAWLFVTHKCRFAKPGDYLQFEICNFSFFLIMNKDREIKGFHNVCRHRAFPLVTKENGSSLVLGCKYHGWSYNSNGELIKAPGYDNVQLDKSKNSLFPVQVHVAPNGMIFVNFSPEGKTVEPFEEYLRGLEGEYDGKHNFDDYEFYTSYSKYGDFNWKCFVDGYTECLHCSLVHKGLSKVYDVPNSVITNSGLRWCRFFVERKHQDEVSGTKDGFFLFQYPNAGVNCYSPGWYHIRISPTAVDKTRMDVEYYKNKSASVEEMEDFLAFGKQVQTEDFELCQKLQENLKAGVYSAGLLNPIKEDGVLFYQNIVRSDIEKQLQLEKTEPKNTAKGKTGWDSVTCARDETTCKEIAALAW